MRIAIVSDCQFSNRPGDVEAFRFPDADVVVVAGDFYPTLNRSLLHLERLANGTPVVYVAGNRDFYGEDHALAIGSARNMGLQHVHFLQDESTVIDGVRFAGATLWTDYALNGGLGTCRDDVLNRLTDHRMIWNGDGPWLPEDALVSHSASCAFFERTLATSAEPVVLVSHHAPSPRSSSLAHTSLHGAFGSDLTRMMTGDCPPLLWVHGATHRAVDYREGGTRVISNPLGYMGENTGYVPDLVVDVVLEHAPAATLQ